MIEISILRQKNTGWRKLQPGKEMKRETERQRQRHKRGRKTEVDRCIV